MVKKKQVKTVDDSKIALTPEEEEILRVREQQDQQAKQQQEQGVQVLQTILGPINKTLEQLAAATTANTRAIQQLQTTPSPSPPQQMQLPSWLQPLIGPLINAATQFFTAPSTPPEQAAKGIFNEKMFAAFEDNMIKKWTEDSLFQHEQYEALKLENEGKRLAIEMQRRSEY